MNLTCPECKNTVDLSPYPNLDVGNVVECNSCGMTLMVKDIDEAKNVQVEIVDEGK
jgi:Zn ribbon nucleic-acid-binding protein